MLDVLHEASLIRKVTKRVYWNSKFSRLRTQIDEEDLVQMVFLKLLHRDNYLKYSSDYSLSGFLYRVANGCAVSFSKRRQNVREWTILDQPIEEDNDDSKVMKEYLTSVNMELDLDYQNRLAQILSSLSTKINSRILIKYKDKEIPFSFFNFFNFFIEEKLTKEEMRQCVINIYKNQPVSRAAFDQYWKTMESKVNKVLSNF